MNFIDIVLIVPIAYAAYKGFKHGFVIEVFTLLAILVGIYVGIHFSDFTAQWLSETFDMHSAYLPVIAFTLTFLAVGALIYFGGKVVEKMIKVVHLSIVNKLAGLVFAAIKMTYILSVILVLIDSYDEKGDFFPDNTKKESLLYVPVREVATKSVPALSRSTIFMKNAMHKMDSSAKDARAAYDIYKKADSLNTKMNGK